MLCTQPFFKSSIDITKEQAFSSDASVPFPCGQCFHCRVNQARVWTHRLLLENFASEDSCFITLTYNEDYVPEYYQLKKSHLRNYLKRIRKALSPVKLRFFGVGEYGDKHYRPHYHLMLFSDSFIDRQTLVDKWPYGFVSIGDCSKDSARYIVGYTVAKLTKRTDIHVQSSEPEFMSCSKQNGGIGIGAIKHIAHKLKTNKYFKNTNINEIQIGNKKIPLGRYLFKKLAEELGTDYKLIIKDYSEYTNKFVDDFYPDDSINPFAQYMKNILDSTEGKRHSREKRAKIFKQRRTI